MRIELQLALHTIGGLLVSLYAWTSSGIGWLIFALVSHREMSRPLHFSSSNFFSCMTGKLPLQRESLFAILCEHLANSDHSYRYRPFIAL